MISAFCAKVFEVKAPDSITSLSVVTAYPAPRTPQRTVTTISVPSVIGVL